MMSTARPAAPAQPLSFARLLDLADLPMARADIELSAPTGTLWPESALSDAARKILALAWLVGPEQGAPAAVAGQ